MVISLIRMYLEYSEDKNEEVVKMCFIVVGVFFVMMFWVNLYLCNCIKTN